MEPAVGVMSATDGGWGWRRVMRRPRDAQAQAPLGTGAGVRVYVVDTAVAEHHDLRDVKLRRYAAVTSHEKDATAHGTAVASLVAGASCGGAHAVELVGVATLHSATSSKNGCADCVGGLLWVLGDAKTRLNGQPARAVVNLSWGFSRWFEDEGLRGVLDKLVKANVVVVAAAGNDGLAELPLPARAPGVIAVGAIESDAGDADSLYAPSNQGWFVLAPGSWMTMAKPDGTFRTDGEGTSFAAPLVAAGVAMYLQKHPKAAVDEVRAWLGQGSKADPKGGDLLDPNNETPNRVAYLGK